MTVVVVDRSGSDKIFPVVMAAILSAVDTHGDLMRMAIASPGNDFRLGACEAPPAIVSTYLGDDMTAYLKANEQQRDGSVDTGAREMMARSAACPIRRRRNRVSSDLL